MVPGPAPTGQVRCSGARFRWRQVFIGVPLASGVIEPIPTAVTDVVAWSAIALFLGAWALEARDRGLARRVAALGWASFAGLWLLLIPHYLFAMRAPIEAALAALAVPAFLYAGLLQVRGRDSLFTLARAVAIMGVVYLPFVTIASLERWLVETVAVQTHALIGLMGYETQFIVTPETGHRSGIVFDDGGHRYRTHIVLACTGLGSMSIFAGLIAALRVPLSRKLRATGVAVVVIYALNLVRNAFIAVAFGDQWFQVGVGPIMALTGYDDPGLVSFFIADRVISQGLAIVALVGITYLVVRTVPELLALLEEALYLVTRTEYDLESAFAVDARR